MIYGQESSDGDSGVSSLADLSDVEIQESYISNGDLLRFNIETNKWENVRPIEALLHFYYGDEGVLTVNDTGDILVTSVLSSDTSDTTGQVFSQLLQAAITYGQYQADDLDPQTFRPLIVSAISATAHNANLLYVVNSDGQLMHRFNLVGATANLAVWSGVIAIGDLYYRVTFSIICPSSTTPASIVVKAEQLMSFTEPT